MPASVSVSVSLCVSLSLFSLSASQALLLLLHDVDAAIIMDHMASVRRGGKMEHRRRQTRRRSRL